ncbi:AraC family ligand binding domain-containing protein [Photobacterium sp. SDRW27]|uniref:AraC family ligand binding domain-containing protein n=1 Tax=Photobacterium obscurum TaxID=2829490 RepID=UPI002242D9F8|nr:AraC family ligand binding domain-containing protein [Photobacterium obscurum]MCW8329384.1 AraC family ligand binding domain-containing protein [Photobacterium obscurum]
MKQAIEFSHSTQDFLHVGARRKSHTSYMIVVTKGSTLIRLGKQEFLVSKGSGFWLPFDCLHALTVLPGTQFDKVEFSSRLTTPICKEAGFFTVTPLITALLNELRQEAKHNTSLSLSEPAGNLLRVMADQIAKLKVRTNSLCPALRTNYHSQLSQMMKGDKVTDKSALSAISEVIGFSCGEFEACMIMREALKLSRSGRKITQIAESLNTTSEAISALAKPILGQSIA